MYWCFVYKTLKTNANRYMEDEVGIPLKHRQEVLNNIFGKNGLTESSDVDVFNTRVARLRTLIDTHDGVSSEKKFRQYFDNKLLPLLDAHVIQPAKCGRIKPNWTSNNSESANHVLKSAVSWKARDMPKFIEMLYDIVNGEEVERGRAIRDMGNLKLSAVFQQHGTDIDHWSSISQEQRDKRMKRFRSDKGKTDPNVVISTDGTRSCLYTPSAGKKKNQVKRKRSEKSRTPSAKRALIRPWSSFVVDFESKLVLKEL